MMYRVSKRFIKQREFPRIFGELAKLIAGKNQNPDNLNFTILDTESFLMIAISIIIH